NRAGFQTARVFAVHAAVLAYQPFQLACFVLMLGKAHQGPAIGAQVAGVVVHTDVFLNLATQVVPFIAGNLTSLAADADGHVNQLGDFHLVVPHLRGRRDRVGGRTAHYVLRIHAVAPFIFSTLTRKALNSGVCVLASPTPGDSVLARKPLRVSPSKPQWQGIPICCTSWPATVSVRMRLVTTALAVM